MNELIKEAAKLMELKYDVMLGDITKIAYTLDNILEAVKIITVLGALEILFGLVGVYLRGHGYRMGNKRGFEAHSLKAARVATAVIARIAERGRHWYPRAFQVGLEDFNKLVDSLSPSPDILAVAEDILRRKVGGK